MIENLKTDDGKRYKLIETDDGLIYIDEKGNPVQPIMMKMDNHVHKIKKLEN